MSQISHETSAQLRQAMQAHDFLHAVAREIENHHRLVFHAMQDVDWSQLRASAEQILMAEIVLRYQGDVSGIFKALEDLQSRGREWNAALREVAARIHSYYTTPLGIRLRADLFGPDAAFIHRERATGMIGAAAPDRRPAQAPKS